MLGCYGYMKASLTTSTLVVELIYALIVMCTQLPTTKQNNWFPAPLFCHMLQKAIKITLADLPLLLLNNFDFNAGEVSVVLCGLLCLRFWLQSKAHS